MKAPTSNFWLNLAIVTNSAAFVLTLARHNPWCVLYAGIAAGCAVIRFMMKPARTGR